MKRVWSACGLLVALCLLSGVVVWIFLPSKNTLSAADKSKALKNILGRDVHLQENSVSHSVVLHKSNALQFSYPSDAKVYTGDNAKALQQQNVLDSFSFSLLEQHTFGVIQAIRFDGVLSEYPAVSLRLTESDVYTVTNSSTTEIHFAKEQDMVERSAFFLKNGKVVSVAVTGYADTSVESLFSQLMTTLLIF